MCIHSLFFLIPTLFCKSSTLMNFDAYCCYLCFTDPYLMKFCIQLCSGDILLVRVIWITSWLLRVKVLHAKMHVIYLLFLYSQCAAWQGPIVDVAQFCFSCESSLGYCGSKCCMRDNMWATSCFSMVKMLHDRYFDLNSDILFFLNPDILSACVLLFVIVKAFVLSLRSN